MNNYGVNQYFGFYRGIVIDNKDPEFFGRVKVLLPGLFPDLIDKNEGIWAYPANNPIGGRNKDMSDKNLQNYGSLYIPEKESWVWIFFEGGNLNNPFYFSSLDIKNQKVPPENRYGSNYELKWTIFRSKNGKVIIISDDEDDSRVEITGNKKNNEDIFTIDGNQKVILIDERKGKEKILIKDEKGNYINIDTKNNKIHIYSNDNINQQSKKDYNITVDNDMNIDVKNNVNYNIKKDVNIKINGNLKITVDGNIDIYSNNKININSNNSLNLKATSSFLTGVSSIDLFSSGIISINGASTSIQNGSQQAENSERIDNLQTPELPNGERG